ncbi:AraC family transcriptional regulator [Solimonas sp. K1W22B-7]|uniref:AraC family transcriptional regulator n=1 Tax=Solimonas sp. K1W22B-7 TaxID=2303331 RepID=UPI000E32F62D|nr:AraC family transcriptional regulator [Solimonas sp. K1W22B-7]AXQ30078.1 AraC family transcriptional regulator [Solimonas sp. K1W22B-7]
MSLTEPAPRSAEEGQQERQRARIRNAAPGAYLRNVVEIAAETGGVSVDRILEGSRVTMAMLETPDLRVSAPDAARIVLRAFQLSSNRGLGYEFGLRAHPAAHGNVGYAAMSCGTLREALDMVARYVHLRQQDMALRFVAEGDEMVMEARDNHNVGPLRDFLHESLMVGFWRMIGFMLGEPQTEAVICYEWPEPDYHAAFRERLPVTRFSQPVTQLRIPAKYLDRRLVMAEPSAVKKAVAQLESEMATSAPSAENLLGRVRAELRPSADGYPDLETVASCLFMSGRTLKRKLEARGTSFQSLLDEVRYRDALRLLENPDLDIQQIATMLGYRDPPSFTRAFKRWSGCSPSELRAKKDS